MMVAIIYSHAFPLLSHRDLHDHQHRNASQLYFEMAGRWFTPLIRGEGEVAAEAEIGCE